MTPPFVRRRSVPLGVDLGTSRVRVAHAERDADGRIRLVAVAARPAGADRAAALADARAELATKERRCILAIGAPDGVLKAAAFPAMRRGEREQAARYEAARGELADAAVRIYPLADGRYAIAAARAAVLREAVTTAARAGLRAIAVDDAGLAVLRALGTNDAILDLGASATRLIVPDDPLPAITTMNGGGTALTAAIAAALGIDPDAAARRKHAIGTAGAGEDERARLVAEIAAALIATRAAGRRGIAAVTLVGNAARLPGLCEVLDRALALPVRYAALALRAESPIPGDVLRAAAPDWALAYGLALWSEAA